MTHTFLAFFLNQSCVGKSYSINCKLKSHLYSNSEKSNWLSIQFKWLLVLTSPKVLYYKLSWVNNKMLEYDWLLTTLIYGLISCFRSKLSDLTCLITNINFVIHYFYYFFLFNLDRQNWTVKQPMKFKHSMPLKAIYWTIMPPLANQNEGKFLKWAGWQVQIENKHGWN